MFIGVMDSDATYILQKRFRLDRKTGLKACYDKNATRKTMRCSQVLQSYYHLHSVEVKCPMKIYLLYQYYQKTHLKFTNIYTR